MTTRSATRRRSAATRTATASACPGAPEQRLAVDEDAKVCTKSEAVFLRVGPGRQYEALRKINRGTVLQVINGPSCANNWSWWNVELPDGTVGWMAEGGDRIDPYFLRPN